MKYLFRGDNFGFTEDELHLQGGNSGFQKIALTDITNINICNGMLTNNPFRTSIFSLVSLFVVIAGVFWVIDEISYLELARLNERTIRGFGGILACIGLIFTVGMMAFSLLSSNRIILKVKLLNGSIEVRSLKVLGRKNGLSPFLKFLTSNFSSDVLNIESKVLEKLGSR